MARIALLLVATLGVLTLAACGGDDEPEVQPPEAPMTETEPSDTEPSDTEPSEMDGETQPAETDPDAAGETTSCTNEDAGYTVHYPADWHTNEPGQVPSCTFFDAEPFEVPEATEFFGAAVSVGRDPVAAEEVVEGADPTREVLEREETQVAGRRAFRMEARTTGQGLLDAGVRYYQVVVAVDGESLIVSTYDLDDHDYERNREVVDAMVDSLELLD